MSTISKQALVVDNNQSFPNNNAGAITPTALRNFNTNMIDSLVNEIPYQSFSSSVTNSINLLNQFSASQQPSFNALNTFTGSQLTINSGVNGFTQSANARLNSLQAYTASFTTSVGIYNEGIFVQNVNEIDFVGNGIAATYLSGKGVIGVDFTPLNNFTASTSTQLTALNNNFNSYTSSTNAQIAAILITTASLATTGSNTFTENNTFTKNVSVGQSIYVDGNIYVQGGIEATYIKTIYETASVIYSSGSNQFGDSPSDTQILSGSSYVEGALYVNKLNVTSQFGLLNAFTASQLLINTGYNTFTASTQSDLNAIHLTTQSLNAFTASQLATNNTLTTTASFNSFTASQNILNPTFATTGSNAFVGNQRITGSLTISSSAVSDLIVIGRQIITGSAGSETCRVTLTNTSTFIDTTRDTGTGALITAYASTGSQGASLTLGVYDSPGFNTDIELNINVDTGSGILFNDFDNVSAFNYVPFMSVAPNLGNNPAPVMTRGLQVTGSLNVTGNTLITGSLTLTGSAYGNVISQSIVSSTASIDLSKANFYTVALPASTNTLLNVTNPGKGQTAMIQITSNTLATASFSSNVKQPSGFGYLPSTGSGAIDVLTLACFDGTNLLVTNVTNLV